jgi:hypothetical protein
LENSKLPEAIFDEIAFSRGGNECRDRVASGEWRVASRGLASMDVFFLNQIF